MGRETFPEPDDEATDSAKGSFYEVHEAFVDALAGTLDLEAGLDEIRHESGFMDPTKQNPETD